LYIEELAARHFPDLTIMKLNLNPKEFFTDWLTNVKNAMLITGAKGRNGFSEFFRRSFVARIIKEHRLPVFVAHL
jgi:hypothetical protein